VFARFHVHDLGGNLGRLERRNAFKVDVPRTDVIGRLEGRIDARVTSARGVRLKAFVERPPRWRITTDTLAGPPPGRQCLSDTENFVFSSETGATIRPFRRT
jgi:hypothetical protein